MTYRELYDEVIESGNYLGSEGKIKALANLIYHSKVDGVETKDEAVWDALERYEDMTGFTFDPTEDEFEDFKYAITGD
mgnify:FL=1